MAALSLERCAVTLEQRGDFGVFLGGTGREIPFLGELVQSANLIRMLDGTAFLTPKLFSKMYEQNKGHPLPPPAAIERQIELLGISPKQKERARSGMDLLVLTCPRAYRRGFSLGQPQSPAGRSSSQHAIASSF
jgi:hypothetical protein